MAKRWVTLFPQAKNIHLIKDVGYIPYKMYEKYHYDSYVVCYKNDDYIYLNSYLKGLKIKFLKRISGNQYIDGFFYLLKYSKQIDILHIFHFRKAVLLWIMIYKLLNKNGKVYLKLDANEKIKKYDFRKKTLQNFFINSILKKCKLISVETKILNNWLNENWPVDIKYLPNGFWKINEDSMESQFNKQNVIITVGRIGSEEKNNELLLDSFIDIYKLIPKWSIVFVGNIEKNFYKNSILKINNDELRKRIKFTGQINNLHELNEIYGSSKILCMTSKYESFGMTFVEALKNGCYIVTSNVLSANDVTNNSQYGQIFEIGDKKMLESILIKICNSNKLDMKLSQEIKKYAYDNFDWDNIIHQIYFYLNN